MSATVRLTVAQALVRFLAAQYVERDGERTRFFAGCFGIFGHGNVAGLGEALLASRDELPYRAGFNEQAIVHVAAGYARQRDRLATYAVTTSVGPGATNLVTGAALATINRLPVLLLPGDTFATRRPHPVLQQLERRDDGTVSVNDALRPVSAYFDRIVRPEQLVPAALEAMRVLTDPAETGAVTLALPQDVQTEVVEVPEAFLAPRTWLIQRQPPAPEGLARAVELIRAAKRPLIVAGGGVIYSRATEALRELVSATGIPVGESHAGRGALPSDHPGALGAIGATGSAAANRLAAEADLVIGVGTRWSDFTTSSKSAFQDPGVRFVNVNVCAFDAAKHAGLQLIGDARVTLDALTRALAGHRADEAWTARAERERQAWSEEVARLVAPAADGALNQAAVIGAVNDAAGESGVVVQAAGSMPGDLHKLWRARDPRGKGYHVEYGYSTMGYEIPGAIGVKLAAPERPVFSLVGDGSYLMLSGELVTAVAQRTPIVLVLVQNHGYASIGALSRSLGIAGFGTHHRAEPDDAPPVLDAPSGDALAGDAGGGDAQVLPVDLAANVASLGVPVTRVSTIDELRAALAAAAEADGPVAIHVEVARYGNVGGYDSWWDVPVAEVSERAEVRAARERYEQERTRQRVYLEGGTDEQ